MRSWAAAYGSAELPYGARLMTADPRWATLGGTPLAVVLCPVLSTGFALSIGFAAP